MKTRRRRIGVRNRFQASREEKTVPDTFLTPNPEKCPEPTGKTA
jgi:hypothetical protein